MIAIIGANGKVGSATARALRERGHDVRAIVRNPAHADALAALGCEIAIADVNDADQLGSALTGASAVQVIVPLNPRAEDAPAETDATIASIVRALATARPERILAISDYGAHLAIDTGITTIFYRLEQALGDLPGEVVFLRSAEHMQNWARVASVALSTGFLPSLHQPLDKVFPTVSAFDAGVISADLLLEADPPRIVHVEGPHRYRPLDVAAMLTDASGRRIEAVEIPLADRAAGLARAGMSASYAALVGRLYDVHNEGLIDAEPGGEIRRGTTDLSEVLTEISRSA